MGIEKLGRKALGRVDPGAKWGEGRNGGRGGEGRNEIEKEQDLAIRWGITPVAQEQVLGEAVGE